MFFYVFRYDNVEQFCDLCGLLRTLDERFSFHRFEAFLCFGNRILSCWCWVCGLYNWVEIYLRKLLKYFLFSRIKKDFYYI